MRIRSQSDTPSLEHLNLQPVRGARSAGGRFFRGFQKLLRSPTNQGGAHDGAHTSTQEGPQVTPPPKAVPTFQQCLEDQSFCEAGRLLIERENLLYGDTAALEDRVQLSGDRAGLEDRVQLSGDRAGLEDRVQLSRDRAGLEDAVLQTVQQSLSLGGGQDAARRVALRSALRAIEQEERQDQLWRRGGATPPPWRPSGWRRLHDARLAALVEERMESRRTLPRSPTATQSSIQLDISSLGLQLQEDLLLVVQHLKACYPPEDNICHRYAARYHHTFSRRLSRLLDFVLADSDCSFLLRWVNLEYPRILQAFTAELDAAGLGKLLTEELLEPLELQYLDQQQNEVTTFLSRVLEEEKKRFARGEEPLTEDGCYVSPVAFDILQLLHAAVTSAELLVGDLLKAQTVSGPLGGFMQRFQSFHADVMRQNRRNSRSQVKANLGCVAQFRDVLVQGTRLVPETLQEDSLALLEDMRRSAQAFLLAPVHKVLKPHYQKLGTSDWLHKRHFHQLLDAIEAQEDTLQGCRTSCHQELVSRLHQEVMEEYVRRLLRGDVKLKDKQKQVQAHDTVKDEAETLHTLFCKMGSQENWLKELLNKIAEVLKLQDVPALQVQVVSLGSEYPDFSERHVSALLKLKTNLCKADRRTIRATLVDTQGDTQGDTQVDNVPAQTFFSRVDVR